jgi:hypothetical protein
MGSIPPAAMPIRKHMSRLAPNNGIVPQIAVPMNIREASRIAARRPMRSAMTPQNTDPSVVPVSAHSRSHAPLDAGMPYSADMPGSTKPSVAGFIVSITNAIASTSIRPQCAGVSFASSIARTSTRRRCLQLRKLPGGSSPHVASTKPADTSTIPATIIPDIVMPARW